MQNGTIPLSHSRNIRQAIHERYSTPMLKGPCAVCGIQPQCSRDPQDFLFIPRSSSPTRRSQNGAIPFGDIHEARCPSLTSQPRDNGQRLASPREPNHISTNATIVPSSSCVEGKPAVKPCSYRPSPNYVLSQPHASLTPHSCVPPHTDLVRALSRSLASD